jgi:dipeptidase E
MPGHILPLSFNGDNYYQLSYTLERFLEYALTLVQKKEVNFCYIGTASHDRTVEDLFFNGFAFLKFYNSTVSLHPTKLSLTTNLTADQIEKHIRNQDIIFVGGGDTEFMLSNWKDKGFEAILKKLKDEDRLPVIMGLSAGGIFPFHSAISLTADTSEYKALTPGYNWLKDSFCPHANSNVEAICTFDNDKKHNRMSAFVTAIKVGKIPQGYAIPDDCMLHFYGEQFVGAFSARENENIEYSYVTSEGVEQIKTTFLKRKNSSKLAKGELKELRAEIHPEQERIYANQCALV